MTCQRTSSGAVRRPRRGQPGVGGVRTAGGGGSWPSTGRRGHVPTTGAEGRESLEEDDQAGNEEHDPSSQVRTTMLAPGYMRTIAPPIAVRNPEAIPHPRPWPCPEPNACTMPMMPVTTHVAPTSSPSSTAVCSGPRRQSSPTRDREGTGQSEQHACRRPVVAPERRDELENARDDELDAEQPRQYHDGNVRPRQYEHADHDTAAPGRSTDELTSRAAGSSDGARAEQHRTRVTCSTTRDVRPTPPRPGREPSISRSA